MAKAKPKAVNPQPPAGNALKPGSERGTEDLSEDPLKEVEENAAEESPAAPQFVQGDTPRPAPSGDAEEVSGEVSEEERRRMIEEAAYYCSQQRLQRGEAASPDQDWAEAEAQIDRLLAEQRKK
jgi:hypothetical protein